MPQDRFIHPRLGHSHRIALLTDLEFRAWIQYILSADDFGVMRLSGVTLQSGHDALQARPTKMIQRAFERLLKVALVASFDHQGRQYAYQPNWQLFQKIEWPRSTFEPKPPADALATCDDLTQKLFGLHPGGVSRRKPKDFTSDGQASAERIPNESQTNAENFQVSRAHTPAERLRLTAKANGERLPANGVADETAERAGELLRNYARWFSEERRGAKLRLIGNTLEFQDAISLVTTWDDARLEKLAKIVLTTDDTFIAESDRGFKIFALKASWADGRLSEWEAKQARA